MIESKHKDLVVKMDHQCDSIRTFLFKSHL